MNKKYKIIKKVLNKDTCNLINDYFLYKKQVAAFTLSKPNYNEIVHGGFNDGMFKAKELYFHYGDNLAETLLIKLQPLIEKHFKKKLIRTYSFMRIYEKGSILHGHKDRISCQYSATLHIKGDYEWPFYVKYKNNTTEINLSQGDLVIYKGEEVKHWRKKYKGDYYTQIFLHYIDAKHPEVETYKYDKIQNQKDREMKNYFQKHLTNIRYPDFKVKEGWHVEGILKNRSNKRLKFDLNPMVNLVDNEKGNYGSTSNKADVFVFERDDDYVLIDKYELHNFLRKLQRKNNEPVKIYIEDIIKNLEWNIILPKE